METETSVPRRALDADDKKLIVTWLAQGSPSADDWVPP